MHRLLTLLAAALLLGACAPPAEDEPATTETPDTQTPDVEEVQEARDALGDPAVALAESVIALGDELDAIRHEIPRGRQMQRSLTGLDSTIEAVLDAADDATAAAEPLAAAEDPAVREAVEVVDGAVADARAAVDAAEDERAALTPLAELDAGLDAAVEAWDEPGSQSERRAALAQLAEELDLTAEQAEALTPVPAECPEPWERRPEWARLLADRTRQLEATATGQGGATYDELRAEFSAEPYGEDRQAADAGDRDCWLDASEVAQAREAAPEHVADLEAALNPES